MKALKKKNDGAQASKKDPNDFQGRPRVWLFNWVSLLPESMTQKKKRKRKTSVEAYGGRSAPPYPLRLHDDESLSSLSDVKEATLQSVCLCSAEASKVKLPVRPRSGANSSLVRELICCSGLFFVFSFLSNFPPAQRVFNLKIWSPVLDCVPPCSLRPRPRRRGPAARGEGGGVSSHHRRQAPAGSERSPEKHLWAEGRGSCAGNMKSCGQILPLIFA